MEFDVSSFFLSVALPIVIAAVGLVFAVLWRGRLGRWTLVCAVAGCGLILLAAVTGVAARGYPATGWDAFGSLMHALGILRELAYAIGLGLVVLAIFTDRSR